MNTTEFNLFAKSNCNRIPECNSLSLVSEGLEEFEEDEIRRNEEIKEMMQNAFDDLDEDYQSINSSSYLASLSGCCNSKTTYSELSPRGHNPTFNGNRTNTTNCQNHIQTENEQQYLKKIQNLELELNNLQKQYKDERSKLLEKFFIEEEEKKLAQKKHEEVQKLFYESQVMLLQRENELKDYQEKLELSEKEKMGALEEVKMCKLTIEELEQRLVSQENKTRYKEEEIDNLKEKFSSSDVEKFSSYQKEIETLNEKLALKDRKYIMLEFQLLELQQLHKSVIAEKSEVIAKLSNNLEECQTQSQKLMHDFNRKWDKHNSNSVESLDTFKASRQSLPANMRTDSKLFEELFRAYAAVKEKNSEIKFLQEQLKSCIKQLKSGKEMESQNVEDINLLKQKVQNLEEINDQIIRENRELKNDKSQLLERESFVDQSSGENMTLKKKLEISEEQSNKLKNMYLEVSTAKEKLLFQNQQLQIDVDKLKNENSVLNEIVKTLNNDMSLIPVHCDSLVQESIYMKYCPQNNNESKHENIVTDNESEELRKKLTECEDELKKTNTEHAKQLEVLQIGIKDYVASTEVQHQLEQNQLRHEFEKKILEIESKQQEEFSQFETEFKEQVLKVSTEEIKHLSNTFQKHFDDISEKMTRQRTELEDKNRSVDVLNKQLESIKEELQKRDRVIENLKYKYNSSSKEWKEKYDSMNEKHEKLLLEIDKIYTKYKTTRKIAIDTRQLLNSRSELLLKQQQFYTQTLNEIQNYLNETLECKSKNEKTVTKFDITKEDLIIPDEEINAAILAIKKQLESLNHCK